MGQLLGVHGIAAHQSGRNQLLASWSPALADGLERALGRRVEPAATLDIAYYGDLFLAAAPETAKSGHRIEDAVDGLTEDEIEELATDAAADFETEELAAAQAEVTKARTRLPRSLLTVARAVDRRFGVAAGMLHIGVLRQVRAYLTDLELKSKVDARVAAAAAGYRVLIGHSLGSVVAYEYLRQHPEHSPALVMLGSPLGLRMVRDRLSGAKPDIADWVAIRDLRDPVGCAGNLGTWWPVVRDRFVDNGNDAHSVLRYLGKKETGEAIVASLPNIGT